MTKKDLKLLDDLLKRAEDLPDILHLRASAIDYKRTEDDKRLLINTYQELDDILKEVAAFINIRFPGCHRHIKAWDAIDFDTKIGDFKVITTDREHIKRAWKHGLFDLKDLIRTLKHETLLLLNEDDEENVSVHNQKNFHGNIIYNDNSNIGAQNMSNSTEKSDKQSTIEMLYWIAGILVALISIYTLLK